MENNLQEAKGESRRPVTRLLQYCNRERCWKLRQWEWQWHGDTPNRPEKCWVLGPYEWIESEEKQRGIEDKSRFLVWAIIWGECTVVKSDMKRQKRIGLRKGLYFRNVILKVPFKYSSKIVSEQLKVEVSSSKDRLHLETCLRFYFINGAHPHIQYLIYVYDYFS